jgi:uncharacterized membrane protein YiaA
MTKRQRKPFNPEAKYVLNERGVFVVTLLVVGIPLLAYMIWMSGKAWDCDLRAGHYHGCRIVSVNE